MTLVLVIYKRLHNLSTVLHTTFSDVHLPALKMCGLRSEPFDKQKEPWVIYAPVKPMAVITVFRKLRRRETRKSIWSISGGWH